jgi:oligoribonuclease NrnB/cAMP/cGMP phosphodiesterase (DHH superfamily)
MAAAVFLRKYPEGQAFPLSHGATDEDFAPILEAATQASHVYFLDCEIGHECFLSAGHKITIIDHHIGAYEELTKVSTESDKLTYVFNNEKSGASLSWEFFFPGEEMPMLIQYIEDADLWRLQYGEVTIGARTYCSLYWNNPGEMGKLLEVPIEQILEKGKTLYDFTEATIRNSLIHIQPLPLTVGPHTVHAYNVTMFQSMVGNQFSKEKNSVVVLYTVEGDIVRTSIRSCEGQSPTALDIAKLLGGGGHTHASGAEVPTANFFSMLRMPE